MLLCRQAFMTVKFEQGSLHDQVDYQIHRKGENASLMDKKYNCLIHYHAEYLVLAIDTESSGRFMTRLGHQTVL